MEAALRSLLESTFGDYVDGLQNTNGASFPLTMKDLRLKEKKIQEELDEDGGFPFDITDGRIGAIKVTPGWMGTVEIVATNIVLNFSFSPMKAMNQALKGDEDGSQEEQMHAPGRQHPAHPGMPMRASPVQAAPVAPRYCTKHGSSEQRVKVEPRMVECTVCHTKVQTNYEEFTMCPQCSDREQRCMLCGEHAPTAGNYVPAASVNPNPPPEGAQIFAVPKDSAYGSQPPRGGNGPSRLTSSGGNVPPPPPPAGPRSPNGKMGNDFDWLPSGNSAGGQGFAPPPPPPPRGQGRMQVPASRQTSQASQGGGGNWQRQQQQDRGYPGGPPGGPPGGYPGGNPGGSQRGRPGAPPPRGTDAAWPGSLQELQDKSAAEHMNNLFGYLQSIQIPTVDISSWASCMNATDMRYDAAEQANAGQTRQNYTRAPPGGEPRPFRGGA